jgi:hypothetical protein
MVYFYFFEGFKKAPLFFAGLVGGGSFECLLSVSDLLPLWDLRFL